MGTGASKKKRVAPAAAAEQLIRAGDANDDGKLSVAEAKRLLCAVVDRCDADDNGLLDVGELAVLLDDPARLLADTATSEKERMVRASSFACTPSPAARAVASGACTCARVYGVGMHCVERPPATVPRLVSFSTPPCYDRRGRRR